MRARSVFLVGLLAVSCAGREPAPAARTAAAPPVADAPVADVARAPKLARAEVDAVLDAGIPTFLRSVETEARVENGRFVGFEIRSFFPGDPRFAGTGIETGDVVVAVNGLAIERPEDFFRVWQELRVASELSVDLVRGGRAKRLSYVIE